MNNNIKKLEEGKTISVSALPDCIHKSRYMNIVQDAKQAKVIVVAILNPVNDTWEAYIGYPDVRDLKIILPSCESIPYDWLWFCENIRDAEQVKIMGDLLNEDVAIQLFPDWRGKKYSHA